MTRVDVDADDLELLVRIAHQLDGARCSCVVWRAGTRRALGQREEHRAHVDGAVRSAMAGDLWPNGRPVL